MLERQNVYNFSTTWAQDCVFCQCLLRYIWPYWSKLYDEYGFCGIFLKKENQYMLLLKKIPVVFKTFWFSVITFLWCFSKVWQECIFPPHHPLSSCLHPGMCTTCRTFSSPHRHLPQVGIYERSNCISFWENCNKGCEGMTQITAWPKLASHTAPENINWFSDLAKPQERAVEESGSGFLWRVSIRRKQYAW